MSVTQYEKNGKVLWQIYLDLRGRKDSTVCIQRRLIGFESEREALVEEKRLLREISEKISTIESRGGKWGDIIEQWVKQQRLYPSKRRLETTIQDYEAVLRNWTKPWLNRIASELNRGDARAIFRSLEDEGKSYRFRRGLKYTINLIYRWGIEERLINGVHQSPVMGLEITSEREEKKPEILTHIEIRNLLKKAKEQKHPWYPIWVGAVLTGCRSGELHQLKRSDLEIISRSQAVQEDSKPFDKRRYGFIRVHRSWNTRLRKVGFTKAGYWRTVPISSEFYWFLLNQLKVDTLKPDAPLFPRCWEWDRGMQASVLRGFCVSNQIPSIRFHTLRACFATQLITTGIPATTVMKICGWRDLKTMQRYIRLAGIDEAGATELLHFIPTDEAVMEKVVSLYGRQE